MIENLLKRFLSEEGKLVYAAVEKWNETHDIAEGYIAEPQRMYELIMEHGPVIDRTVIRRQHHRHIKLARKLKGLKYAQEVAAQILMGEKFNKPEPTLAAGAKNSISLQAAMSNGYNQAIGNAGMTNQDSQGLLRGAALFGQQL